MYGASQPPPGFDDGGNHVQNRRAEISLLSSKEAKSIVDAQANNTFSEDPDGAANIDSMPMCQILVPSMHMRNRAGHLPPLSK